MKKNRKFITIEGIDGSGKSTQAGILVKWLAQRGGSSEVVHTFEPGSGLLQLREILLRSSLCKKSELLLFLADRLEHVRTVINPALEAGKWVVCERYYDSTLVYQSCGRGLSRSEVESFFAWCEFPVPDLTLLFDISVESAAERLRARGGRSDKFESAGLEFMEKLRLGYKTLAKDYERISTIDASRDLLIVGDEVRRMVAERFEL